MIVHVNGLNVVGRFIRSEIRILSIIALSVTSLVACATNSVEREKGWPPVSSEIRQEFESNQDGLEALSLKMSASTYSSVIRWGDDEVAAYEMDDEDRKMNYLAKPQEWIELFESANADSVDRYFGQVTLHRRFEPTGIVGETLFDHAFVMSNEAESTDCLPHYAESECGSCVERINDNWHVSLMWYPNEFLSAFEGLDEVDTEESGELIAQMQTKMESCMNRFSDEF